MKHAAAKTGHFLQRRRALRRVGVALAMFPLGGLTSCGGSDDEDPGAVTPTVHVAGTSYGSMDSPIPGRWSDGQWVGLALGNAYSGSVGALVIDRGDVYIGGSIAGSPTVPGYWKNGTWVPLTPANPAGNSRVRTLVISEGDVYAAGDNNDINYNSQIGTGFPSPGYWKNGVWTQLAANSTSGSVSSLIVVGSDVYAAGFLYGAVGSMPGYWKNGSWVELTPIDVQRYSAVESLVVSGGDVYAAGNTLFNPADNLLNAAEVPGYWLNGTWVGLVPPGGSISAHVSSIHVSGTDICATGTCVNNTGLSAAGYWSNGAWIGLPSLDPTRDSVAFALARFENDIYLAGYSTNDSGVAVPGYWKNGSWVGLAPLDATRHSAARCIVVQAPS